MSSNQLHGKKFEDILKATFSGSSDSARSQDSSWDIEAKFDSDNLPISIKTKKISKSMTIEMADARKFFTNTDEFKLIVALYEQIDNIKSCCKVIEFVVRKKDLKKLKGNIKTSDIINFHNSLKSYPIGEHNSCREYAKEQKKLIQSSSFVKLNAKIDSKSQRRLQCSISLDDLISTIPESQTLVFTESYRELVLPLKIISDKRNLSAKQT